MTDSLRAQLAAHLEARIARLKELRRTTYSRVQRAWYDGSISELRTLLERLQRKEDTHGQT